jgi:hypothetical protein
LFAHIHFGQQHVATAGNTIAFLCGGGDKPACPAREGEVTGVIDTADVIGPAARASRPDRSARQPARFAAAPST